MKVLLVVVSIVFVLIILTSSTTIAGECQYGTTHAWFRSSNGSWQNATVHPRLKLGEEFEIKIQIIAKIDVAIIFLKLHEFGTPVYEIIENKTKIDTIIECGHKIKPNQCITYQWKLRVKPNTTWINGYGPLEIFVQFNKDDNDCKIICFDVISGFILNDYWEGYSEMKNEPINHPPNFIKYGSDSMTCILILIILTMFRKKARLE